jgi:hypothetical protein
MWPPWLGSVVTAPNANTIRILVRSRLIDNDAHRNPARDFDLFVVLLTNSIHPSARNGGRVVLRRAVNDAAALAITDRVVTPRVITENSR